MHQSPPRQSAVLALLAGAAAWPSALCTLTEALKTPLQRAVEASWCGAGPQAVEFLGHCAACWGGAAAFIVAAAFLAAAPQVAARNT